MGKEILCLAVGDTYDLVNATGVTAHPAESPYPSRIPKYVAAIKKGGIIEKIWQVDSVIDCIPGDFGAFRDVLMKNQYEMLGKYHEERSVTFLYGRKESKYRFYIMKEDMIRMFCGAGAS